MYASVRCQSPLLDFQSSQPIADDSIQQPPLARCAHETGHIPRASVPSGFFTLRGQHRRLTSPLPARTRVRRSSHLEEYSQKRPASAGGVRPRALLNKVAQAAGLAAEDSDAEGDESWVLEGWGEEPSVVSPQ